MLTLRNWFCSPLTHPNQVQTEKIIISEKLGLRSPRISIENKIQNFNISKFNESNSSFDSKLIYFFVIRIDFHIKCNNAEKFGLDLMSPNHLILVGDCENLNENIIKKIRTLIILLTSNINNESWDSSIDKMIIYNVYMIEKKMNSLKEIYTKNLLDLLSRSLHLLNIPNKNIRINFNVKLMEI
jgi:hypothetical protein